VEQKICVEVVIHRAKAATAACIKSDFADVEVSRCSYCDSSDLVLLWYGVYGTVVSCSVQIELRITNDREDVTDCEIHGGTGRWCLRDSGDVQMFGAAGRRY